MNFVNLIRDIPDFPKPGIMFKDITPLLKDPAAFADCIDILSAFGREKNVTAVVGIESRGFIFGAPIAQELGKPFIPIRKPGKLPAQTISVSYSLEYGTDTIEMHSDALAADDRVLIVDDLLATGGTMAAAVTLVEKAGASVAGIACVVELSFLHGREQLAGCDIATIVSF